MVAVVPSPPLMIPQLAAGGAEESAPLRRACLDVAGRLATGCDRWVVLGADPDGADPDGADPDGGHVLGTFLGFGVDVRVSLAPEPVGPPRADLPLAVLIAGWLRGQVAPRLRADAELVAPDLPTARCRALGASLAGRVGPGTGLLVVGDGAVTHTEKAPGHLDPRAGPFDRAVASALADADPDGLLDLDAGLAAELGAIGRAPWQVAAGAAATARGARWDGELVYSGAPYGVGYHVALWRRAW